VDAATVIVARDGPAGLEVLVQERHLETDFVGGALVFPGGRVEDTDRDLDPALWVGGDPADVGARLGTDERGGLGLLVAAARESFEEAGVLYAVDEDDVPVDGAVLADPDVVAARAALAARDDRGDLAGLLRRRGLRLRLDAYHPFAWWVTPAGMHRRYDTRFFVAAVPEGQRDTATSDQVETTSAHWLGPAACLAGHEDGRFTVIFPTRKVLAELAEHATVGSLLAASAGRRPDRIEPEMVEVGGRMLVQHPYGGPPEVP
jgi:8-oxo-dGTP pyrophosphatase MutT (NUDIX family)